MWIVNLKGFYVKSEKGRKNAFSLCCLSISGTKNKMYKIGCCYGDGTIAESDGHK